MYDVTLKLFTPFYDADEDLVCAFSVPNKQGIAKVEHMLLRAQMQLRKLSDDRMNAGKSGAFDDTTNPQETHFEYLVTKGGKKWTRTVAEWPDQPNDARAYLEGMVKGLVTAEGWGNQLKKVKKDKRA